MLTDNFLKHALLGLARQYYGVAYDAHSFPMPETLSSAYPEFLDLSSRYEATDSAFAESLHLIKEVYARKHLECFIDGGVKHGEQTGEHTRAASGYLICEKGKTLFKKGFSLPGYIDSVGLYSSTPSETTTPVSSHIAEYEAFNACLRSLIQTNINVNRIRLTLYTDSQVLCNQLHGLSRNKTQQLSRLMRDAKYLIGQFEHVEILHIPREKNEKAHYLVQEALSGEKDSADS